MLDIELDILRFLSHCESPVNFSTVQNAFDPQTQCILVDNILRLFLEDGRIENTTPEEHPPFCRIRISRQGLLLLFSEEERLRKEESIRQENERNENERQKAAQQQENDRLDREELRKQADRKAEHAFQYKLSLMNAFLTFVSGLITGAILSNLNEIIPWLLTLFH